MCRNKDNTVKKKEKKGDDGLVDKHKLILRKEDSTLKHTSILSRFSISTVLDSTLTTSRLDPCGHLCPTSPTLYLAARRALKNQVSSCCAFFLTHQLPSLIGPLTSFCLSPPLPSPTTIATGDFLSCLQRHQPPPPRGLGNGCSYPACSFTCFSQGWPALVPQTWQTSPPPWGLPQAPNLTSINFNAMYNITMTFPVKQFLHHLCHLSSSWGCCED